MTLTKKLTIPDLERIEKIQQLHISKSYLSSLDGWYYYSDSPASGIESYLRHAPNQASQRQRSSQVKQKVLQILTNEGSVTNLKAAISKIEPYFEGNQAGASPSARSFFKNFQYANDLMLNAWEHFTTNLQNHTNFFSAEVYRQWLAAAKVGLYSACDFYVLGTQGLNYPDLNNNPSPRLEAVKGYYRMICIFRSLVEIFEQEATRWGREGNSVSLTTNDWTDYLNECRQQLTRNFGEPRANQLFRDIFGSPDPAQPTPTEMDRMQMKFFTRLSEELLKGVQPVQPTPTPTGMNRDYTRINNPPPPTPTETHEPNNQNPSQRPSNQERSPSPPRTTDFNSSALNEAVNSLFDNLNQDSQDQGHGQGDGQGNGQGFTPSPGLGMPLNTIMKEEAMKLPWLVVGVNLDNREKFLARQLPHWEVFNPANLAVLSGEGDCVTLLCQLFAIRETGVLHNFFWAKNTEKKGFVRLVKDEETERERERERERANY